MRVSVALRSLLAAGLLVGSSLLPAQLQAQTAVPVWTGPQPVAVPELPPRVMAPTDKAQFRRLVLPNGMRVLLLSDPNLNRSSAALSVFVGYGNDPLEHEGMAHFLEHMISQSSAKYPVTGEFAQFISRNGGYRNAYTTSDHSNYQFQVRHEALEEALDRFSQIFTAPLFNPQFVALEVNAVHNEAMRHVNNDPRRLFQVSRELYGRETPEGKFGGGNKETLAKADRDAVRKFWLETYSADRMALAVTGRAPLDQQEKWVREKFSDVPRHAVSQVPLSPGFLPNKAALRLAQVEPIAELRQLQLEFVIPSTRANFASHSLGLLTQLISSRAPGGLLDHLRKEGLVNNMSTWVWSRTPGYGSLFVTADLTQRGQEQHQTVMNRIHAWFKFLQSQPYPQALYSDMARIAALSETYGNRGEGADLAVQLANQVLYYPLEVAERAATAWGKPDEASYRQLLAALRPDNMLVTLAAKGVKTDRRERIYNVAYSYTESTGPEYTRLLAPTALASFALPTRNPFMPSRTDLLKAAPGANADRPDRLINEPGLALYHSIDTEFERPQTSLNLRFVPDSRLADANTQALVALWARLATEALEADIAQAALAGTSVSLSTEGGAVGLAVSGYGDSPLRVARHVATQLRRFQTTPARFADLKEQVLRGLRSYPRSEAIQLGNNRVAALTEQTTLTPDQLLGPTEAATQAQVEAMGQTLFQRGRVEAVVHGHVSAADASAAVREVHATLAAQAIPAEQRARRRFLVVEPAEQLADVGLIEGPNSYWTTEFQLPDADQARVRALSGLVSNFVGTPFFTELRTRQQLGYIVGSGLAVRDRARSLRFVIQSSSHSAADVRDRAEAYIKGLPALLEAASDADWAALKAGVRSQLEAKPKSISERTSRLASAAYTYEGEWDRPEQTLAALEPLTKADAVAFLRELIDPAKARRLSVLLDPQARPPAQPNAASFTDREAWKRTRSYR